MSRKVNLFLALLIVLGIAASAGVLFRRAKVESGSRTVQVVLDYSDAKEYCSSTGYPLDEFLLRMKKAGVNSIGVHEARVRDLVESGQAILLSADGGGKFVTGSLSPGLRGAVERARQHDSRSILILPKEDWVIGFMNDLTTRLIGETTASELVKDPSNPKYVFSSSADPAKLSRQRFGMDRNKVTTLKDMGFIVVPRYANFREHSPKAIQTMLEQLQWCGDSSLVIFDGADALGYRTNLDVTADLLGQKGTVLGLIEFAPQKGIDSVAKSLGYRVARVHSVSSSELESMPRYAVVERFVRAVRERGIRILYLRPFPEREDSVKLVSQNEALASDLVAALKSAGFRIGVAVPFDTLTTSFPILLLVAFGVSASCGLLLWHLAGVGPMMRLLPVAAGVALFCGLTAIGKGTLARQLMALAAAFSMPAIAVVSQSGLARRPADAVISRAWVVKRSFALLASASILSAMGGMFVVGLLGDTRFMLKFDQFVGVKLMHVVPVCLAAWVFAGGRAWLHDARGFKEKLSGLYRATIPVSWLVWLCAAGLIGLVYLLRTGNNSVLPVLDVERSFRSFLEQVFIARPRTKEFLLAHPVLMLGFAMQLWGYRRPALVAFVVGTIGQASIVNTFSHIHTPVLMAVARWGYALLLGGILGLAAIHVFDALMRRKPAWSANRSKRSVGDA